MNFFQRLALAWRILVFTPGNLLAHADRELKDARGSDLASNLKEIVLVFATQGHSGFSASLAIDCLVKLLRFEPLGPLTGSDDEWNEVGPGVFQNNRCSRVFKQADRFDGQAYDIEGKVFREPNGACYTSRDSMTPVVFPYHPETVFVDVPFSGEDAAVIHEGSAASGDEQSHDTGNIPAVQAP